MRHLECARTRSDELLQGTKSLQTITATVNYGQDSGNPNRNRVRFSAKDIAGNLGMAEYAVRIDTTPPDDACERLVVRPCREYVDQR